MIEKICVCESVIEKEVGKRKEKRKRKREGEPRC
jgi:hypothetical protein